MGLKDNEKKQENCTDISESKSRQQKTDIKSSRTQRAKSSKGKKRHTIQKLTVNDWARRLEIHLNRLSPVQRDTVFAYLEPIRRGIYKATKDDGLDEYEQFEEVKESYEYNLLIKITPYILSNRPWNKTVEKWAKKLTMKRKYSWKDWLFSQRELIQANAKEYRLVFDGEGNIMDVGLPDSEWIPPINPPNPFSASPEDCLIEFEKTILIQKLPAIIGKLDRKRALEFLQIFLIQLYGVDVIFDFGQRLLSPAFYDASLYFQMIEAVREILMGIDPDLEKKITIYKLSKGKTWKIKKSTKKERKALYRDPYAGQKIACTLRVWRVIDCGKGKGPAPGKSEAVADKTESVVKNQVA